MGYDYFSSCVTGVSGGSEVQNVNEMRKSSVVIGALVYLASPEATMRIGDTIRVVKLPDGLEGDETKLMFELCLGKVFSVVGIVPVPEANTELLELHVGGVIGKLPVMHSIWIEKEFVEMMS